MCVCVCMRERERERERVKDEPREREVWTDLRNGMSEGTDLSSAVLVLEPEITYLLRTQRR